MLYVWWHNGGKYKNSEDCDPDEIRSIVIYSIRTSSTPPVLCFIEIDQAQLICPPCFAFYASADFQRNHSAEHHPLGGHQDTTIDVIDFVISRHDLESKRNALRQRS
jgi:hypothetical protein